MPWNNIKSKIILKAIKDFAKRFEDIARKVISVIKIKSVSWNA